MMEGMLSFENLNLLVIQDQETALSAMRNLDGFEIAGRKLRVDNACTEKSRMEMQNLLQVSFSGFSQILNQPVDQEPVAESPFGPPCEPGRAPETISRAVASLPPEQMFQLMQQMKLCIQNNPGEARTMLMQNPQLAYALLQAQGWNSVHFSLKSQLGRYFGRFSLLKQ